MPVDYKQYPPNWLTEIRPRILERDGNRCKWCGVENGAEGVRDSAGLFHSVEDIAAGSLYMDESPHYKPLRIVLTVAHLDHNPANNADDNLAALCQRCHLGHDREEHMRHAAETRDRREGQLPLLDGAAWDAGEGMP